MAASHLVAYGDLTLLGNVDADHLVHAGVHLVAVFTGEYFDINDDAALAVRHLQ